MRQEVVDVVIEGDRRRTSMLVEGILDPDLYMGGMSDFLYTIVSTMEIGFRNELKIKNYNPGIMLYES